MPMRTLGSQIVPARVNELRRVLLDLSASDMAQLDPSLGASMEKPLGRELLAARLPVADSAYICLYNLEPSGLIVLRRSRIAAQIRALAVSPDLRRKGLARSMLNEAERRVRVRGLRWLWMRVPSDNVPATKCALACGFRRYRPQFLRCGQGKLIPAGGYHTHLETVGGDEAANVMTQWYGTEVACGDAWVLPLIEAELLPLLLPQSGQVWRCLVNGREAGCVHVIGPQTHPVVSLWLDQAVWNTSEETECLRSALSTFAELPPALDVWLGSEGHLRASVGRFKALGFQPLLDERVYFVRGLEMPSK